MADFHLYIGYRHTSSWSLRGWMPMRKTGAEFEETLIRYRLPDHKARLAAVSPTAKVPFLIHRRDGKEFHIWDSLAIGEYLAEFFPEALLWPKDPEARAFARSISAEMHSGFRPLREFLNMALLESHPRPRNAEADASGGNSAPSLTDHPVTAPCPPAARGTASSRKRLTRATT